MKHILLIFTLFISLSAIARQVEVRLSGDTIYRNGKTYGLLVDDGVGFKAHNINGDLMITIKEDYYRFVNGKTAYPFPTEMSKEKTAEVIVKNELFNNQKLNEKKVNEFVSRHPNPPAVLNLYRSYREEVDPVVK